MRKETLGNTGVGLLCAIAVVWTAINVRDRYFPPLSVPDEIVQDWRRYAAAGHREGAASAPVTVVVFSDYQCLFCKELNRRLSAFRARHEEQLAVVWRHLPLEGHDAAEPAARAAVCGADQDRFRGIHSGLFGSPNLVIRHLWVEIAAESGVRDTVAFQDCMRGPMPVDVIERDRMAAGEIGALGTPTILINSGLFRGVPRDLERIISHAVADR